MGNEFLDTVHHTVNLCCVCAFDPIQYPLSGSELMGKYTLCQTWVMLIQLVSVPGGEG